MDDDQKTFPAGRGSQLTPDDRAEIQALSLVHGKSNSEIARVTGRDRGTVAAVLRATDTKELEQQLASDSRQEVLRQLRREALQVSKDWVRASAVASERGDHRPAKDLLLHAKLIDPVDTGDRGGPKVAVIIGTPGNPLELPSVFVKVDEEPS